MGSTRTRGPAGECPILRVLPDDPPDIAPAWELVGAGRYMPRRIRGSFPGRELG